MPSAADAPFNTTLLDTLMEQAGIDLLLVTARHTVQYLLGGYRFFFFEHADAIGQSRYLPILLYPKGRPDACTYIGHRMEKAQQDVSPLWVSEALNVSGTSTDAMQHALDHIRKRGLATRTVGIERSFLPDDAAQLLRHALHDGEIRDAIPLLERLRARKSEDEIAMLRHASEGVIAAMLAVIEAPPPGTTKRALVEALRREQVQRGLEFDYCLITTGTSLNRAPSGQTWDAGGILSLDSGGNDQGYIGDVCRMGIHGTPDQELIDLLSSVDEVQQSATRACTAGTLGGDIFARADQTLARMPERKHTSFVAHGMGLVSHEVPHLTAHGPVPYEAEDAERPLESGMVLSLETTLQHPRRGFIKLEDTVVVREGGYEILGQAGRGWNSSGASAPTAASAPLVM